MKPFLAFLIAVGAAAVAYYFGYWLGYNQRRAIERNRRLP